GYAITTGALHMAPHGDGGPLARAVRSLGLPFDIVPRDVQASFYFRGQHVLWNRPWDVMRLFGRQGCLDLLKVTAFLSLPALQPSASCGTPFDVWLASQTADRTLRLFFDTFVQFAAGVRADQIAFSEMSAVHRNVQ